ncbi:MAG TPA: bifunctional phosphopantothenoylcysteine decarboxylase/phosphopantothenate--cysteine ligase CoaBC [Ignavibacteriaceae bacterium]|jgi:phosphopantothenoylcysteine decarboxylase/phosphopantothenate--cysteine ligase|nr:bifunctional phosphopantothenoylcysteine decarboxylase/phosphopantothenate--cysteine ligase CoaBC [Ignavibacteriaceae bacterium]
MYKDVLSGKKIIVGITGCIAAYKSCLLVRDLMRRGAEVKVVMTPSALEFIAPLTLAALTRNDVIVNTFPASQEAGVTLKTWHIDYALWADLMVIAPASVNTVAKIANGFCDNALTTLTAALRCPLLLSPAADVDMYQSPFTQENIMKLKGKGIHILEAEEGELASGLSGKGRLPEIDKVIDSIETILSGYIPDLKGKKIMITAGPTYEDIDPVRFIGNRSSGKMGYEIAKAAFLRGTLVTLITGPSSLTPYKEIKTIKVRSAKEMKAEVESYLQYNDALIMAAAVADYTPQSASEIKIKKEDNLKSITLKRTEDILSSLKNSGKVIAGFALETDDEINNAQKKLASKHLDMIVLNSLQDAGSGFEVDTNKVTIIHKDGSQVESPLQSKFQTAHKILTELKKYF